MHRDIQCNSAVLTGKNLGQNIVVANVLAQKIFCREIFGQKNILIRNIYSTKKVKRHFSALSQIS
jgi:hypothetical protein